MASFFEEVGIKEPHSPLLTIALDGETIVTVGRDEPPCAFDISRRVGPESALVFTEPDADHVHRFGELSGWAHFSFRVQAEKILRADCFITQEETLSQNAFNRGHGSGIRFQPLALQGSPVSPQDLIGTGAFARGLHSAGLITPGWYRLSVECDACLECFHLQSFHAGMMDVEYMYSESGLHTLVIQPGETVDVPDLARTTPEALRTFEDGISAVAPDGTRFGYFNALRCPHCRAPFFDYGKFPEDRKTDYYGHSHLHSETTYWKLGDEAEPLSRGEGPQVFEARYNVGRQYVGMGAVGILSLLGFVLNGVIPTESTRNFGAYPLLGWSWVAGCALLIAILVRRVRDRRPQLRIDAEGLWVRGRTERPIPWDQIAGTAYLRMPRAGYALRVSLCDPAILGRWPLSAAFAALETMWNGGDFVSTR